jgi:hypothetical protein
LKKVGIRQVTKCSQFVEPEGGGAILTFQHEEMVAIGLIGAVNLDWLV